MLALGTFGDLLAGALWSAYVDNQGVLGAMVRGSCSAPEANLAIGRAWLDLAETGVGLHMVRVESKANVADGPTREGSTTLEFLGASYVEPRLPPWAYDLWRFPGARRRRTV